MEVIHGTNNQQSSIDKGTAQHIIVMTRATAGLGAHALEKLAGQPNTRIMVGARGTGREVPPGVEVIPLDLASLSSVREFAESVKQKVGSQRVSILALNAGMQYGNNERKSEDGYELTFAVNHLAHYLLIRLLLPLMAEYSRIVITTSDTHDPAVAPMGPKKLVVPELAHPTKTGFGSGIRAYAASKLCNIMTALFLTRLKDVTDRHITVLAFNPGLTGGTKLGRDASGMSKVIITILMYTLFPIVRLFKPEFSMGKPEDSGEALANVALGNIVPPPGKIYVSLVKSKPTFPDPSELARNRDAQDLLWRESEAMVGTL